MHSGAHHYFTYAAAARLPFIWAIGLYGVRLLRQKRTSPLIGGRDERRVEIICHHKSCQILCRRGAGACARRLPLKYAADRDNLMLRAAVSLLYREPP
jgi:hypothetical protein